MTLVLGYADAEIGFLVSDTLLTPIAPSLAERGPVAGEFHGLKIQIIHPNIAIAFASRNDADGALQLICQLSVEVGVGHIENVPERIFHAYRHAIETSSNVRPDSEFLVLQITETGKRLTHINANSIEPYTRAYIGDPEEYKKLREMPSSYTPPATQVIVEKDGTEKAMPLHIEAGEREFGEVSASMKKLAQQRKGSVGAIAGCLLRVVNARISGTLEYMQECEVSQTPWEGNAGHSWLASNSGARGIGIYFRAGRFGFILKACDPEYLHKESANSLADFIEIGKTKYGLELVGGSW